MERVVILTEKEYDKLLEYKHNLIKVLKELLGVYEYSYSSLTQEQIDNKLKNERCNKCKIYRTCNFCFNKEHVKYGKTYIDYDNYKIKFEDCPFFKEDSR